MNSYSEKMAAILAEMIDARGSRRAFAEKIGVPPTTLQSMLTKDLGRASVTLVLRVCKELGITFEQLEDMASGKPVDNIDDDTNMAARIRKLTPENKALLESILDKLE